MNDLADISQFQTMITDRLSDITDYIFGIVVAEISKEETNEIVKIIDDIEKTLAPKQSDPFSLENIVFDIIFPAIPFFKIDVMTKAVKSLSNIVKVNANNSGLDEHKSLFENFTGALAQNIVDFSSDQLTSSLRYTSGVQSEFAQNYRKDNAEILKNMFSNSDSIKGIKINDTISSSQAAFVSYIKSPQVPSEITQLFEKFTHEMASLVDDFLSNTYKVSGNNNNNPDGLFTLSIKEFDNIYAIVERIKERIVFLKDVLNDWIDTINDVYWLMVINRVTNFYWTRNNTFRDNMFKDLTKKFILSYKVNIWFLDKPLYYDSGAGYGSSRDFLKTAKLNMLDTYKNLIVNKWNLYTDVDWKQIEVILKNNQPTSGSKYLDMIVNFFSVPLEDLVNFTPHFIKTVQFRIVENEDNKGLYYALHQHTSVGLNSNELSIDTYILLHQIGYDGKVFNKFINKLIKEIIIKLYNAGFHPIPSTSKYKVIIDRPNNKYSKYILIEKINLPAPSLSGIITT